MPAINEGKLRFEFPPEWKVSAFDNWSYYRGQFARLGDGFIVCNKCDHRVRCADCGHQKIAGIAGIDILALAPNGLCWHIEIKDYRLTRDKDFLFLADSVALKIRDTLACLAAARLNSNDELERQLSQKALASSEYRVILHLERPPIHNPLRSSKAQRKLLEERLKQLVKAVDPHPKVVSMAEMNQLPWSVKQVPKL